jgi:DsbC/DsbD-like thiol-disulfide interchange protein
MAMPTHAADAFPRRAVAIVAVAVVAIAALAPCGAEAQQGRPQPVKWSVALEPATGQAAAGGKLVAVVTAAIGDGWHVYAPDESNVGPRPVELTIVKNQVFTAAGRFDAPEPEREMDQAFDQVTASYTEKAAFRLPVAVAADAPAGPHAPEIDVSFQACDGNICLPAKAVRVSAIVTVTR